MKTKLFGQLKTKVALVMTFLMISCLLPVNLLTAYADDYTVITTAAQLDTVVRNNLSGNYKLGNDIDLSSYSYNSSTWTSSKGWEGIGSTQAKAFKGTFDGDGYTISGLWSYSRGSNQGLFGWLSGATIKNLNIGLSSKGISKTGERIGVLAGNAYSGTVIDNVNVVGEDGSFVQGSANYVAGLVGVVYQSSINNSSVTNVDVSGGSYVAGLAGVTYGGNSTVSNSYVVGATVNGSAYAGGFIGFIYESSKVSGSYAEDVTVSTTGSYAGGFIGSIKGSTVEKCYVMGTTTTAGASYAGGFSAEIYYYSDITSCYIFDADVKAKYYAGGFVGTVYGSSTVQKSCAYGKVATTVGYIAGGFAGEATNATISNAYAQVDVTSKSSGAGGFIAYSAGKTTVYNTYCAGTVSAGSKTNVGAYVGHATITFTGTNYYDSTLCSLSAYGTSGTKSGSSSSYPQGYNTETMKKQATFVGWDFATIWRIDENITYPYFWDWGWWVKESTITFDANGGDGVMEAQVVEKGVDTALNTSEFTLFDHQFLGWTTVAGGDDVEYANGATINIKEDTTLYAVWGTPNEGIEPVSSDTKDLHAGDKFYVGLILRNYDTKNSVAMKNTIITIELNEHVTLDSVVAVYNGSVIVPSYSLDPTTYLLTIDVGTLNPGDTYTVLANMTMLGSGEGLSLLFERERYWDVDPF